MKKTIFYVFSLLIVSASCTKDLRLDQSGNFVPLTVTEDENLPSIEINGVRLHSESFGNPQNPMMVVIHGGPGADYKSVLNFKDLASDGMYVVFYDQRGSGLSERLPASGYKAVQVFIDELDAVINHYQVADTQKVVLAGHSWGAMLATAYVDQNPQKISGLILAEPGGLTWEQTESYIQKSRKLNLFGEETNDLVYQDQFITGSDHNSLDYKLALSTASNTTTGDDLPSPFWRYGAVCNSQSIELAIANPDQMNFTKNLSSFEPKVLFAYSELNTAYGLEHASLVSSSFLNVSLLEVSDCGHEMPSFGWPQLYSFVKNYLTEIL